MEQLIADLEAATEGSQGLEFKIAVAVDWHENGVSIREFQAKLRWGHASHWQFPQWTRSLDAAMTLVPVGAKGHRMCTLLEIYSDGTGNASVIPFVGKQVWSGKVATPELALCIAALRARQSNES